MALVITRIGDTLFQHQKDGGEIIRDNAPNATSEDNLTNFKTRNGANLYQKIDFSDIIVNDVFGGTGSFGPFASISELWDKLIELKYFDGANSGATGGSGVTRFDQLLDGYAHIGNDGKVPVSNAAQNKLVPTTFYNVEKFEQLSNTPVSLVANKIPMVNDAGTELIWVDMPSEPEQFYNSYGFISYDGNGVSYPYVSGELKVLNNAEGALTDNTYRPYGVLNFWDAFQGNFKLNELVLGDRVTFNLSVDVVTTVANQNVRFKIRYAVGTGNETKVVVCDRVIESLGTNNISFNSILEMNTQDVIDAPCELLFESSDSCDVVVGLFKIEGVRRDVNNVIITDFDSTADHYKGEYDADTNSPNLTNGIGNVGDYRVISVAGTHDFGSGDIILGLEDVLKYNGVEWFKEVDNNQSSEEIRQDNITTITSITTDDLTDGGFSQFGKNNIIKNGVTAINITSNGVGSNPTTYQKGVGTTGSITFVSGGGRSIVGVDGTLVLNGGVGSTAVITSDGTTDFVRISNA